MAQVSKLLLYVIVYKYYLALKSNAFFCVVYRCRSESLCWLCPYSEYIRTFLVVFTNWTFYFVNHIYLRDNADQFVKLVEETSGSRI